LYIASNRGVMKNIYIIPIPVLDDEYIESYFESKATNLSIALEKGWEIPCSNQESWDGVKCREYCEVWEHCSKGKLVHSIGG
jgi:hypothetical protein